ncbi:MAG: hypothetical protein M3433_01155 [Actinomycetota bacterium]|nr:hypothetical protein [Actinomycetota bacterium]
MVLVVTLAACGVVSFLTVRDSLTDSRARVLNSRILSQFEAAGRVYDRIQRRMSRVGELELRRERVAFRPTGSRAERFIQRQELRRLQDLIDSEQRQIDLDLKEAEAVGPPLRRPERK